MVQFFDQNSKFPLQKIASIQEKEGCRVIVDQRGGLLSMEIDLGSEAYELWKTQGELMACMSVCLFASCSVCPVVYEKEERESILRILDEACSNQTSFATKNTMEFVEVDVNALDDAMHSILNHSSSSLASMRLHVMYQNCAFSFPLYGSSLKS